MMKVFFIFVLFSSFNAFSGVSLLTSEKNTSVYLKDESDEIVKALGATPLKIEHEDLPIGKILVFEKAGYGTVYFPIINGFEKDSIVKVRMKKLDEMISPDLKKIAREEAELLVDEIMLVQQLIEQKKIAQAIVMSENLKEKYPESQSVKLIYANALLMSGSRAKAVAQYELLLKELPEGRRLMRESIENVVKKITPKRFPAAASEKQLKRKP
jgi:hypothetical protein